MDNEFISKKELLEKFSNLARIVSQLGVYIDESRSLIEQGKEVVCYRKLQATITKYKDLESLLIKYIEEVSVDVGSKNI